VTRAYTYLSAMEGVKTVTHAVTHEVDKVKHRAISVVSHADKLIIEFIGTYFLVLTVGMVKALGTAQGAAGALAIGSSLMVCVFAGGHISGAHYNPAVSLGVYLTGRGKMQLLTFIHYVLIQLLASVCAALTYWGLTYTTFAQFPEGSNSAQACFAEAIYTFMLVHVVLNTATTKSNADNSFYGLAIGFSVTSGAVAVGDVSGGVFNPAVGFGPIVINSWNNGSQNFQHIWIYFLAPLAGAALAALVFRLTNHQKEFEVPSNIQNLDEEEAETKETEKI